MTIDEIKSKLKSAIRAAIKDHFTNLKKINPRGYEMVIDTVENVYFPAIDDKHLDLAKLFSGAENEINIDGSIVFFQKQQDGSIRREIGFWCKPVVYKYDSSSQRFIITRIENFVPLDNR